MRFRLFPSAFTGRAVPSGRCRLHGPSRSDVSPAWAPTLRPVRPCGFLCLASRFLSLRALETPPARVIRARCLSPTYRTRDPGCYRDLAGRFTARRRSWDLSFPSQCSSDPRAVTPHRHDRAHLPFRRSPAASFIVAGPRLQRRAMGYRGRGSWASRRSLRSAVPCHPPTPPWLLCTGSFVRTGQDCPGIFGPLSGLRRRASGLHFWRPFRPGFSNRHPRRRCSDERREPAAVPFGVVGGRRLADPGGVSTRTGVPV